MTGRFAQYQLLFHSRARNFSYSSLNPFQLSFYPQDPTFFKVIIDLHFVSSDLHHKVPSDLDNQWHSPLLVTLLFLKLFVFFTWLPGNRCFLVFPTSVTAPLKSPVLVPPPLLGLQMLESLRAHYQTSSFGYLIDP